MQSDSVSNAVSDGRGALGVLKSRQGDAAQRELYEAQIRDLKARDQGVSAIAAVGVALAGVVVGKGLR